MLRKGIRTFGLFFGGVSLFVGGGVSMIYGILLFYVASPGTADPQDVVGPLNEAAVALLTNPLFLPVAVIGLSVFIADVRRNGLLDIDERTYWEKKKDMRREKAQESDAWDPPPEDQPERDVYDELIEQVESGELVLESHQASTVDGRPSVRGVVRNTAPKPYRNDTVKVAFIGPDGDVVDTRTPATKRLRAASNWEFEVFYTEGGSVSGYDISEPDGTEVEGVA